MLLVLFLICCNDDDIALGQYRTLGSKYFISLSLGELLLSTSTRNGLGRLLLLIMNTKCNILATLLPSFELCCRFDESTSVQNRERRKEKKDIFVLSQGYFGREVG